MPITYDMTDAEYFALRAMSSTVLKAGAESMRHMRHALTEPFAETDAMRLGSLVDCMALTPERFDTTYAVTQKHDRRTKAGKEAYAEFEAANPGKIIVTEEEHAEAAAMVAELRAHPKARPLLETAGHAQAVVQWTDEETRLPCKAKLDRYVPGVLALDLKTARSVQPRKFAHQCAALGYAQQVAWYTHGFEVATGQHTPFTLVAVSNTKPYIVAVYTIPQRIIEEAHELNRRLLRAFAECQRTGYWPGYSDSIEELDIPPYAVNFGGGARFAPDDPDADIGPF